MSYQVLARKWRPKNFSELVGQEHVVSVLTNALSQQRLHHAYLFTGTRGVGKTTIARIFAKSLNCLKGVSATPCGQCDACLDIDAGRFVDLLEIDAASRTKVDDTREILDNVQYAPTRGRYKVYLIDEVHMLSRSSFNALLKTLEEPPSHVKFVLATTDPQKLPITVLSRCLQFHLKAMMVDQISQHLNKVLEAESVSCEQDAVVLLAKAAKGSIRDSLSLTDQAIAQGKGVITLANVRQMLGGVDDNWVYKILIYLIKSDSKSLMALSDEIASYAPNYSRLIAELIQLLHQVAIYQVVESHFNLTEEQTKLLIKFSKALAADDVQLYYQIALNARKDLPYVAEERGAFDMMLLRMLAFQPQVKVVDNNATNASTPDVASFDDVNLPGTSIEHIDNNVDECSQPESEKTGEFTENTEVELAKELLSIEAEANTLQHLQPVEVINSEPSTATQFAQEQIVEPQHGSLLANEFATENDLSEAGGDDSSTSASNFAPASEQTAAAETVAGKQYSTSVDSILATRNMLRSRKKAQESGAKKLDDASERQTDVLLRKEKPAHVPEIESLPEQGFTPEVINPAQVKFANQVDRWANMIDTMELGGRLRVLAGNSTICESSTEDTWVFKLDQSVKHLKSEAAHQQLEENLSVLLGQKVSIVLELVEETVDDPFKIQSQINDKRLAYAKSLIHSDEVVQQLQTTFQATIDEESIAAR
ncbi:DNA polymerase III subunit gamma/tau [Thalassotalea ganghwensis]